MIKMEKLEIIPVTHTLPCMCAKRDMNYEKADFVILGNIRLLVKESIYHNW